LNRPLDKENIAESLNNMSRDKLNMSTNNLSVSHNFIIQAHDKPLKKLLIKSQVETNIGHSTGNLMCGINRPCLLNSSDYQINELENIKLLSDYSDSLLQNCHKKQAKLPNEFLMRHEVNGQLRAKMVDWMIEVFSSYKCLDSTFFKGVDIMDRYFSLVSAYSVIIT
jgi:hypothetical protein